MRGLVGRIAAATAVLSAGFAGSLQPAAGDTSGPTATPHFPPTHRVTSTGDSTRSDILAPLAGSRQELVYEESNEVSVRLLARDVAGGVHELSVGDIRVDDSHAGTRYLNASGWSLAGSMLTARTYTGPTPLLWWNLSTGAHGSRSLPESLTYDAAAPDGIVVSDSSGSLFDLDPATGKTTLLGAAVPAGGRVMQVVVSNTGYAVVGEAAGVDSVAYSTWAQRGQFTTLSTHTGQDPAAVRWCNGLTDSYLGCEIAGTDASSHPRLLRLDGTPPAAGSTDQGDDSAVAGDTLVYLWRPSPDSSDYTLTSVSATAPVPMHSTTVSQPALLTAYRSAVFAGADGERIFAATDADHVSLLVGPEPAPVTTDGFAITPTRVVYADDQTDPNHPGILDSVRERTLTVHQRDLALGRPAVVGHLSNDPSQSPDRAVFAAGATRGYQDRGTFTVHWPAGSLTAAGALRGLSDRWVIYLRDYQVVAYDRSDGTRSYVSRDYPAALSGNRLVLRGYQRLFTINLATGRRTSIVNPGRNVANPETAYISGHHVGWYAGGRSYLLDDRHPHRVTTVARRIVSMCGSGALFARSGKPDAPTPIWLRSYSGQTRKVLSSHAFGSFPRAAGDVLVWTTAQGALIVRHL